MERSGEPELNAAEGVAKRSRAISTLRRAPCTGCKFPQPGSRHSCAALKCAGPEQAGAGPPHCRLFPGKAETRRTAQEQQCACAILRMSG